MKFKFTVFLLLVIVWQPAIAVNNKYRIMFRDDPATTMAIGWNQVSGTNPVVYYGTSDFGTDYSRYSNRKDVDRKVSINGMNNHFVRLTGLKPNTAYYFVIHDSEGTSKRFWFKTAPADPTQRLSVVAGGDSRDSRTTRQNANKLVSKLRPHVILFGGDMTRQNWDFEWQDWFDDWQLTIGTDGRMIPIVVARGNHEASDDILVNHFDVPHPNVYYALTFGTSLLRVYTLNSETSIAGSQTDWLSADLTQHANVTWKMAQYHRPMRPHVSTKSDGNTHYRYWSSLFYQHKVKLVIECDAHTVKATWPVIPSTAEGSSEGFIRDDKDGTVFLGEGCWGAPLRTNDDDKPWTRNSGMFNQFNWIIVSKDKIEARFVKTDNADKVGTVNDNDIFTPPSNLDIWNPSNGSVVVIPNQQTPQDTGLKTITSRVSAGTDDAEEREDGSVYLGSSDLELVYDNSSTGNQTVGMRFPDVTIPRGAVIKKAYVQFTADENSTSTTSLRIHGESRSQSAPFTANRGNVTSRTRTTASVNWSPPGWSNIALAGIDQQTPDLSAIVQEIINLEDWNGRGSIGILINGTGKRTAAAYEKGNGTQPVIHISYEIPATGNDEEEDEEEESNDFITSTFMIKSGTDDAEERADGSVYITSTDIELVYDTPSTGNQTVGLRFPDIDIPRHARIKSAFLQFTTDESSTESTTLQIYGESSDHALAFNYKVRNVSARSKTEAHTPWNPQPWSSSNESGASQRSPDISAIVQEITSRSGWKKGNAIAFIITGKGKRTAWSYEGSPTRAAKLIISYTDERLVTNSDWQSLAFAEEVSFENSLRAFPNPASTSLMIQRSASLPAKEFMFSFRTLNGSEVNNGASEFDDAGFAELDVTQLKPGFYMLTIASGTKTQLIKIIKE